MTRDSDLEPLDEAVATRLRRAFGQGRELAPGEPERLARRLHDAIDGGEAEGVERVSHGPVVRSWRGGFPAKGTGAARSFYRPVWSALAGLCAGIAVIVAGWHVGAPRLGARRPLPVSTYVTGNGQRANITLTDGTSVVLDVASRLDVPADYPAGNHTLRLNGQALFTVVHHDGAPFTVIAGDATARVLGTSFVVRHYATDSTTTVAVREGKVAVRSTVVTGDWQVDIGAAGVSRARRADLGRFSFATGVLTLKSVPLIDAIAELNRWYNADIRLGSPALARRPMTGEYVIGSLADLAAILELTFDVRVERDGRVLTLYAR